MDIDSNAYRITHDLRYRFNLQDRRLSWNTYIAGAVWEILAPVLL